MEAENRNQPHNDKNKSDKIRLSVIIPAYNEEERIKETLQSIDAYLTKQPYNYEIIIIANNCTDNTVKVISEYQKIINHLKLFDIKIAKPGGAKGWAVKRGMEEAKGEYKLFMDADNATRVEEIENFWPFFNKGCNVVIGSRHIRGSHIIIPQPWYRQILGRSANLLIRMVLLPKIKDTQCGFKAFSSKAADKIFEKMTIGGWGFDMEVLALARFCGFKIAEVPVRWYEAGKSRLQPAKVAKDTLWELFKIKKNFLTGLYKTKK
ncbi:MAG: glycosyltransferase family 2 protein [Patescibacteria group bacterium]|nr:glycosyltransferase family 2 protein [Patescibacteria group bacterium]